MHTATAAPFTAFSRAELHAMWRAGTIAQYGIPGFEFYLPLDRPPTMLDRARSLQRAQSPGRVVVSATAFWVYVGGPAPARVQVARRSWRRTEPEGPIEKRYGAFEPSELVELCGVTLTNPRLTASTLVRDGETRRALALLQALTALHPVDVVNTVNLPHRAK